MARQKPRERAENGDTHTTRRSTREHPTDQVLAGMEDIKDAQMMAQARIYAVAMAESEEALEKATKAKQSIRTRMSKLDAHLFLGHGYEFVRTPGEEKFSARKTKRGSKPEDTVADDSGEE